MSENSHKLAVIVAEGMKKVWYAEEQKYKIFDRVAKKAKVKPPPGKGVRLNIYTGELKDA